MKCKAGGKWLSETKMQEGIDMKTRIMTGILIALLICIVLIFSGNPLFMSLTAAGMSAVAAFELFRTAKSDKRWMSYAAPVFAAVLSLLPVPHHDIILGAILLCFVIYFIRLMGQIGKKTHVTVLEAWIITCGITLFYRSMVNLRQSEGGIYLLIAAILVCVLNDMGAFFVGKAVGKHKLAPKVSPNKTVEGSIGGILSAAAIMLLLVFILDLAGVVKVSYAPFIPYIIIASVLGQFGDLSMSAIKRIAKVKDYGKLFPGHGGILDRFDSHMFVLPFTYLWSCMLGAFIA